MIILVQVTRLGIGSDVAIPASSFVIVRRLSNMLRQRNSLPVKSQVGEILLVNRIENTY